MVKKGCWCHPSLSICIHTILANHTSSPHIALYRFHNLLSHFPWKTTYNILQYISIVLRYYGVSYCMCHQ